MVRCDYFLFYQNAGVAVDNKGRVEVNDRFQTNIPR